MANYTKIVDFAAKDALNTGDPVKLVKGTELGAEYDAIAVAIATKANTASPAFTGVSSFAVGAVGAPSIYMTGYTTTGWYNIGANNWGFAVSGAKVLDIASTGLAIAGTLSASGTTTLARIDQSNGSINFASLGNGSTSWQIGTQTALKPLDIFTGGVVRAQFSDTGLAVTGALSATGNISASSVSLPDGNAVTWGAGTTTYIQGNQASAYMNFLINSVNRMALTSAGLAVTGDVSVSTKTPASAAAAGVAGTITWDANYLYVCTATNTWKRVAIATW